MRIHTLLLGQPQTITDEQGAWQSAIFRTPIFGPVMLEYRGLVGDAVADTFHHGAFDQAVCAHPLDHYTFWNAVYQLTTPETRLGPGSVGENWTLSEATEDTICIGDIFSVGQARVQVSAPRYPCPKQERKLKLPGFCQRVFDTLRFGFYLRVLTSGVVQAGDELTLETRLYPDLTLYAVNVCTIQTHEPGLTQQLFDTPELYTGWKQILQSQLAGLQ